VRWILGLRLSISQKDTTPLEVSTAASHARLSDMTCDGPNINELKIWDEGKIIFHQILFALE
jgi:hypothetical protein